MTANNSDWAPEIEIVISGVPKQAVIRAVRSAAREFCENTLLWSYDLDRINIAGDTQSYSLTIPDGLKISGTAYAEIIGVDDVKYKADGKDDDQFRTLDPVFEVSQNLHSRGAWKYRESTQPTKYYVDQQSPGTIYLLNIPTEASTEGLLVKVNLRPTMASTVVPDFLWNTYVEVIANGALSYLFSRMAMPWTDLNNAMVFANLFRAECANAKWKKTTGATKRPMRVKMRRWV